MQFFLITLFCLNYIINCVPAIKDDYYENLVIKSLPDGQVYAHFLFETVHHKDIKSFHWENHYDLFPLSLGKFISSASIQELHFSLTRGFWKHNKWGYPVRDASSGAELSVYFQEYQENPQKAWKEVTSILSGQFCASMNFIDKAATVQPNFSFRPQGILENGSVRNDLLFYAALPHEAVCTENLTPWKKLLPCFDKSGLSSLLNAMRIFDSNFFSLALDLRPICLNQDCSKISVELLQSVSLVYNPPKMFEGKQSWSLNKLFGSFIRDECELASKSSIFVDVTRNDTNNKHSLIPNPDNFVEKQFSEEKRKFAVYHVKSLMDKIREKNLTKANVANIYESKHIYSQIPPPLLHASRYITGYGVSQGGITCRIHNNYNKKLKIIYFDIIPWYLRMYTHTIEVRTEDGKKIKPDSFYYKPAKDRSDPHHLEMILTLPPSSVTIITFKFDRQYLKWTEYPPDANHGVYVDAAVISFKSPLSWNVTLMPSKMNSREDYFIQVHTQVLLVSLPTPDFSMPYNVICLVSTVVSLAFGPIHSLTTKKAKLIDENEEKKEKKSIFQKIKGFFGK